MSVYASPRTQLAWGREYHHVFNNHTAEHSGKLIPLMDLRLSLIWATRGSESEGCRRSGQILVNPVTVCLGVHLQNAERLISS